MRSYEVLCLFRVLPVRFPRSSSLTSSICWDQTLSLWACCANLVAQHHVPHLLIACVQDVRRDGSLAADVLGGPCQPRATPQQR